MSDSSERYNHNNNDYDGAGANDNTCYGNGSGNGAGGGEKNTGVGGGSAEWMRFLSPITLSEMFGATAKAKASLSKNRENPSWEKVRIKYYGRERMKRSSQRTHQKQQEVKEGVY